MSFDHFNQNFHDLVHLELVSGETIELFSSSTRDKPQLPVYKDRRSGVIFIRDLFDSSTDYQSQRSSAIFESSYSSNPKRLYNVTNRSEETHNYYVGKDVLDFGCGTGETTAAIAQGKLGDLGNPGKVIRCLILNKLMIKC